MTYVSSEQAEQHLLAAALLKIFCFCPVNAGGVGKTLIMQILHFLAEISNMSCGIVDLDHGNHAFKHSTGIGEKMSWGFDIAQIEDVIDYYKSLTFVGLDVGANTMATSMFEVIQKMVAGMARENFTTIAVIPVTPAKPGAVEFAIESAKRFSNCNHVWIVQNDQDGSADFDHLLANCGYPVLNLAHLASGYKAVMTHRSPTTLHKIITHPEPAFELASAAIAQWVHLFAKQPTISQMFGQPALDSIASMATNAPINTAIAISTISHATDSVLKANMQLAQTKSAWRRVQADDRNFLALSAALHEAYAHFDRVNT